MDNFQLLDIVRCKDSINIREFFEFVNRFNQNCENYSLYPEYVNELQKKLKVGENDIMNITYIEKLWRVFSAMEEMNDHDMCDLGWTFCYPQNENDQNDIRVIISTVYNKYSVVCVKFLERAEYFLSKFYPDHYIMITVTKSGKGDFYIDIYLKIRQH